MNHLQSLPVGTELVDDFRVERVLGAGGFGITYLAQEPALARKVTIKEYFPNDFAARDKDDSAVPRSQSSIDDYKWGLDRFIDEAQTLAKFDHRNIVRVHRYFRANNTGYIVLKFEEGQSLKSWLNGLGRAPRQTELDRIVEPLLDALKLIHDADFLHRDIAPDNIIIRKDNSPVLIDFGSARGELAQHTRTVSALVKPGYSPYEQYSDTSKQQGPWTDIYALAATLYHIVTGNRAPDAPARIVKDELVPARDAALSSYRPAFLKAIDHGLVLDINKRPQSIAAWRGALLAPDSDSEPRRWFGLAREPQDAAGDDAEPVADKTRPLPDSSQEQVPPPPDSPGGKGRLLDYIERLKTPAKPPPDADAPSQSDAVPTAKEKVAKSDAKPSAAKGAQAKATTTASDSAPQKRGFARFFAGNDGTTASSARAPKKSKPAKPAARKPASIAPTSGAAKPVQAQPEPVGAQQAVMVRTPTQPRTARRARRKWIRPLAFKLLIGMGVASVAVAYQDRIPRFELRSFSFVTAKPNAVERPRSRETVATEATSTARPDRTPIEPENQQLLIRRFKVHIPGLTLVRYADAGRRIITTGADSTMKIWSVSTGKVVRTIEMEDGPATALAISGQRVLTGHSEGTVALWNLDTGRKTAAFKRSDVRIWAVAFETGTDRVLSAGHDWTVAIWRIPAPTMPLHVFKGHDNAVQALAYSPVGNEIATGGADRLIQLWNTTSLSLIRTYRREQDFVTALKFSPDGQVLAAGLLNGHIRLLSAYNRRRIRLMNGHDDAITGLRYLADGEHLISVSKDGTARLWNLPRGRIVRTYGSYGAALFAGDLDPASHHLVTANAEGVVTIWRIGTLGRRN